MAKEKRMNPAGFENIAKEITAFAEIIRAKQDQKQTMIRDFAKEKKRYLSGKISKKALAASAPKFRKELQRINSEIKKNVKSLHSVAEKTKRFAAGQFPKDFRVSLSGITSVGKKRKPKAKTKVSKKRKAKTKRRTKKK